MRAKEYLAQWEATGRSKAGLGKIGKDMVLEMIDTNTKRKVSTQAGEVAVIREFDQKWRRFVDLANQPGLNKEGFLALLSQATKVSYVTLATMIGRPLIKKEEIENAPTTGRTC